MKDLFYAIEDFFVNVAFAPYDMFRALELENWFAANGVNWFFMIVGMLTFIYWMLQLKSFSSNNEEDKSITSHSYL
ncbi:MAG: uracil phosphoribosyltransferase [Lacinutrix sp.]|uniref:DUF6341 family protein n=1 Tax=Lacinutrix sp. TaxID=1937692 RepID=UPI0030AE9FCB